MNPPKYGDHWNEEASRKFFAAYHAYSERVDAANAEGSMQRTKLSVSQLVPPHVQIRFAARYRESAKISAEQLKEAVKKHAGYVTNGPISEDEAAAGI